MYRITTITYKRTYTGVENLIQSKLLPKLVYALPKERMDIQVMILETLYSCLRLGKEPTNPQEAIDSESMNVFTDLLAKEKVTEVKVSAARCIMMLRYRFI
jgi:hypothetical protein